MVKSILIIRLSAIGDVIMASPLIGAFRRSYPGSRLAWLVEEPSRPLLETNPELDEVIVWPRNRWRRQLREGRYLSLLGEVTSFVRSLRGRGFDLAVDAQGLLKSGLWAYLSGAPERVGIGSREGSRFLMTEVVDRRAASDRISSQYLLMAEAMGLDTGDFEMEIHLAPGALRFAEDKADEIGTRFTVFAPFTTRPQKHWLVERWRELSVMLFRELGMKTVILGSRDDVVESLRISGAQDHIVDLTGETSLQEAAAMVHSSSLLIGVDTGLTHLGIALKVPTVALFGATRPYLNTAGTSGTVIYHERACSPCRRSPTCEGAFDCMREITLDEVINVSRRILEGGVEAP